MTIRRQISEIQGVQDPKVTKILGEMKAIIDDLTNRNSKQILKLSANPDFGGVVNKINELISSIQGTPNNQSELPIASTRSAVRLNTANGYGSTNTKIRRLTNIIANTGSDITYADSAANGASFTINTDGVYAISFSDNFTAAGYVGISLNSSQLTTNVPDIAAADILAICTTAGASYLGECTAIIPLNAGDIIRLHTSGAATGANVTLFSIVRVS
jgi:hypothetical protein